MAKKDKEYKDTVHLSQEEYECFKKITDQLDKQTTVIRVGDDRQTSEEQLERHKEINKDLRRKVAISVQEKAKFQTEIERLKAVAGEDSGQTLKMMESMEREINKLKKENLGYYDMDKEVRALRSKKISLGGEINKLQNKLEKETETKNNQIEELTAKNIELQAELDIRIKEDNRFDILDL